jgi:hypothetical protein
VAERLYPWAHRARGLLSVLPAGAAASDRVARLRRVAGEPDPARRYVEILAVFSPSEAGELTASPGAAEECVVPMVQAIAGQGEEDSVNTLLRADAQLSLADDLLTVADHTAMASSVELRVPFLDLKFLGLVERMPSRYKVSRVGERKWLYRRAVRPLVPLELREDLLGWRARMGRKLGLSTPLERWAAEWTDGSADRLLLGRDARSPSYLRPDVVRRHLERARLEPRSRQLAVLLVLEVWLRALERQPRA